MAIIYFNTKGSVSGGGPSIWAYKAAKAFESKGHKIIYENPKNAKIALCVIESGKVLTSIDKRKTKVCVRLDGAYFKEYWNGSPGREWRQDMTALHNAIKRDVAKVDLMIYQSYFSKKLIDTEIAKRDKGFKIIKNGVDTSMFKPIVRNKDGFTNLFHIGKIRNGYMMESLIGTYLELKKRGRNIRLILAGSMDAECTAIYNKYKTDFNIKSLGSVPNNIASKMFSQGDIFLAPRMGSSCDNVISEALACGLPCVVPLWGGNSEIFNNEKEGIIVDSEGHWNYGESYNLKLADAVEKIISDLDNFKKRAREFAINNLTIEKMTKEYLEVFGI